MQALPLGSRKDLVLHVVLALAWQLPFSPLYSYQSSWEFHGPRSPPNRDLRLRWRNRGMSLRSHGLLSCSDPKALWKPMGSSRKGWCSACSEEDSVGVSFSELLGAHSWSNPRSWKRTCATFSHFCAMHRFFFCVLASGFVATAAVDDQVGLLSLRRNETAMEEQGTLPDDVARNFGTLVRKGDNITAEELMAMSSGGAPICQGYKAVGCAATLHLAATGCTYSAATGAKLPMVVASCIVTSQFMHMTCLPCVCRVLRCAGPCQSLFRDNCGIE